MAPSPKNAIEIFFWFRIFDAKAAPAAKGTVPATIGTEPKKPTE